MFVSSSGARLPELTLCRSISESLVNIRVPCGGSDNRDVPSAFQVRRTQPPVTRRRAFRVRRTQPPVTRRREQPIASRDRLLRQRLVDLFYQLTAWASCGPEVGV